MSSFPLADLAGIAKAASQHINAGHAEFGSTLERLTGEASKHAREILNDATAAFQEGELAVLKASVRLVELAVYDASDSAVMDHGRFAFFVAGRSAVDVDRYAACVDQIQSICQETGRGPLVLMEDFAGRSAFCEVARAVRGSSSPDPGTLSGQEPFGTYRVTPSVKRAQLLDGQIPDVARRFQAFAKIVRSAFGDVQRSQALLAATLDARGNGGMGTLRIAFFVLLDWDVQSEDPKLEWNLQLRCLKFAGRFLATNVAARLEDSKFEVRCQERVWPEGEDYKDYFAEEGLGPRHVYNEAERLHPDIERYVEAVASHGGPGNLAIAREWMRATPGRVHETVKQLLGRKQGKPLTLNALLLIASVALPLEPHPEQSDDPIFGEVDQAVSQSPERKSRGTIDLLSEGDDPGVSNLEPDDKKRLARALVRMFVAMVPESSGAKVFASLGPTSLRLTVPNFRFAVGRTEGESKSLRAKLIEVAKGSFEGEGQLTRAIKEVWSLLRLSGLGSGNRPRCKQLAVLDIYPSSRFGDTAVSGEAFCTFEFRTVSK